MIRSNKDIMYNPKEASLKRNRCLWCMREIKRENNHFCSSICYDKYEKFGCVFPETGNERCLTLSNLLLKNIKI